MRVDALADWSAEGEGKGDLVPDEERSAFGAESRLKIERRLAGLEGKPLRSKGIAVAPNGASFQPGKWEVKEARKYNPDADGLAGDEPAAVAPVTESKEAKPNSVGMIEEVSDEPPLKKSKKEKKDKKDKRKKQDKESEMETTSANGIKPIEEVVQDAMQEDVEADIDEDEESSAVEESQSSDVQMDDQAALTPPPTQTGAKEVKANGVQKGTDGAGDGMSETISTISADTPDSSPSPTQQEINWQSPIPGNTKIAKKARKKERHARRLILSEDRSKAKKERRDKLARRLARKEKRQKKAEQVERREEREDAQFGSLARQAGLTISRYKRKLERGEIKFGAEGRPEAISKKEIKKARKAAEKAAAADGDGGGLKRKRDEQDRERPEKKKKKYRVET